MRTNLKWPVATVIAFLAFTARPSELLSQGLTDFQVNLYGGTSFFGTESFGGDPLTPAFDFEIESGLRSGLRLNLLTAERWGVEMYYGYESKQASYVGTESDERLDLPIHIHGLGGNAFYYPTGSSGLGRIIPFVTGGIGVAIFRPTSEAKGIASDPLLGNVFPDLLESKEAAYSYGVGVKYRMNRVFGARFDVRGFLSKTPTFGLPAVPDDPTNDLTDLNPLTGYIHNTQERIVIIAINQ